MAHARQRNKTWQARWRLRSGKETSRDGFPTKRQQKLLASSKKS